MERLFSCVLAISVCCTCATSGTTPAPEITQEGRTLVRYQGSELGALVSFRYAEANLGDEWLILFVSLSGGRTATTTVERDGITLTGPDGIRYPLPSQQAFREAYSQLYAALRSPEIVSLDPGSFGGVREPCGRWFFARPSEGFAYDSLDVTPFRVCSGPLVFLIPGGVQPGQYVLEIDLAESKARIPFVLELEAVRER
jgi:hypothetical protein